VNLRRKPIAIDNKENGGRVNTDDSTISRTRRLYALEAHKVEGQIEKRLPAVVGRLWGRTVTFLTGPAPH